MSWIEQRRRAARRRKLARAGAGFLIVMAIVGLLGTLLPAEQRTLARRRFDRPPKAVWRVLTDLDGMPMWRSDLTGIERLPDSEGRATWRETGVGEVRVMELVRSEPPRRLVTHRRVSGRPALPELTFDLVASDSGTLVTVSERAEFLNPFRRILVRIGAGAPTAARLLHDLENRLYLTRRQVAAEE